MGQGFREGFLQVAEIGSRPAPCGLKASQHARRHARSGAAVRLRRMVGSATRGASDAAGPGRALRRERDRRLVGPTGERVGDNAIVGQRRVGADDRRHPRPSRLLVAALTAASGREAVVAVRVPGWRPSRSRGCASVGGCQLVRGPARASARSTLSGRRPAAAGRVVGHHPRLVSRVIPADRAPLAVSGGDRVRVRVPPVFRHRTRPLRRYLQGGRRRVLLLPANQADAAPVPLGEGPRGLGNCRRGSIREGGEGNGCHTRPKGAPQGVSVFAGARASRMLAHRRP
jgi:hypothetical protein